MPASSVPQVFVSATTGDLGSFREAVAGVLQKLDVHPVVQDDFPPDYRSVIAMLRDKISRCDAVICLIGRRYGYEPLKREPNETRRSYTQLEYEIAVALGKPVFVFVATGDCPFDSPQDEPDDLRALQAEHLNQIIASDRIRTAFRSREHLVSQVSVMRFDRELLAQGVKAGLTVLLCAELIDSGDVQIRQGPEAWIREVVQPFHELLEQTLVRWRGTLTAEASGTYDVNFETADRAVNAALALHAGLSSTSGNPTPPALRVGIHLGQIIQFGGVDKSRVLQSGHALDVCRELTGLAAAGQTLLTRAAFDVAREHVRHVPAGANPGSGAGDGSPLAALDWQSHGRYEITATDETLEVCEVGVPGGGPFVPPASSSRARRVDPAGQEKIPPWRPAAGNPVPRRPGWFLEKKLGEGGFGEVWMARNDRTKEPRVFKFCFDASRLTSFKRELTLFKLLSKALHDRPDIARLLDVNLDEGPFFLESEYVAGGNLGDWGKTGDRLAGLPRNERLRLVTEIAAAVAAAHSVGIIHKDLKPSNIFMRQDSGGRWHPILADFGIGALADRSRLAEHGVTAEGFTGTILDPGSSRTGTRMYQPPEAVTGATATVQWDVYALGVLLFQMLAGDFNQPLGHGWERRLMGARNAGAARAADPPTVEMPRAPGRIDEIQPAPTAPDASRMVLDLLKDDISACVEGDPTARLASVAQLKERLETLDKRVADAVARERAERARVRFRRLRAALVVSLVSLAVVGGLGLIAGIEWRRAEALQRTALANEQRALRGEQRAIDNEQTALQNEQRAIDGERSAAESAKIAESNANAARQQSQLALDTLNAFIFDVQQSVANLAGASPIRRRLLSTALKRLEQLSGAFVARSTADRHTAVALLSMGDLVLQFGAAPQDGASRVPASARPGETAGAVELARQFYTRAIEIFAALAKADPNDAQAKRDLSLIYPRLGDVHLRLGATDKALQAYQKGLELREALAKADPNDAQAQRDLSVSYEKLGDVHLRLGATDKALEAYQKDLELREALPKADPNDAQAKRDLSVSYDRLGNVHLKLGATDNALETYQKGLGLREELAKADPNDAQAKRDLSVSFNKLGDVHLKLGATDNALEAYQKGLELSEALAKADPNDAQAKRDLSVSYNRLGDVHLKLGATDNALEAYQKGLELSEALAKADPNDAEAKRDLSISYDRLGDVHLKLGATDKALEAYQKGLELREALAKDHPDNLEAQGDLSASLYKIAQAHEKANDLAAAREWDEKRLAVDGKASGRSPENAQVRREIAVDCEILSGVCARLPDWPAAVKYAQQALENARAASDIAAANKQPFEWDFGITFRQLADARIGAGQFKAAKQSIEEAFKAGSQSAAAYNGLAWLLATCWEGSIRDGKKAIEVATKACELTQWKEPTYLNTLAAAYAEAGRFDEAITWQKKAIDHPEAFGAAELEQVKQRLKLYEAHKPYREPRPEAAKTGAKANPVAAGAGR